MLKNCKPKQWRRPRVLGEEHPNTLSSLSNLTSMSNLASTFQGQRPKNRKFKYRRRARGYWARSIQAPCRTRAYLLRKRPQGRGSKVDEASRDASFSHPSCRSSKKYRTPQIIQGYGKMLYRAREADISEIEFMKSNLKPLWPVCDTAKKKLKTCENANPKDQDIPEHKIKLKATQRPKQKRPY